MAEDGYELSQVTEKIRICKEEKEIKSLLFFPFKK